MNSFASLAQQGYFNDTPCHRLTTSPGLSVLQCGDPTGKGTGGPGYGFVNEYPTNQYRPDDPALQSPVVYPRGTLAMANTGAPGLQRQPVLPGLQGFAAAPELHRVRHDRRDGSGDPRQDRRGRRGPRRSRCRRRRAEDARPDQVAPAGLTPDRADRSDHPASPALRGVPAIAVGSGARTSWLRPPPPQPQSTNGLAIASLICAFLFFPLGIVFGHMSLSQIKKSGEGGHGLAVAGLVISYVVAVLTVVAVVATVVFAASADPLRRGLRPATARDPGSPGASGRAAGSAAAAVQAVGDARVPTASTRPPPSRPASR